MLLRGKREREKKKEAIDATYHRKRKRKMFRWWFSIHTRWDRINIHWHRDRARDRDLKWKKSPSRCRVERLSCSLPTSFFFPPNKLVYHVFIIPYLPAVENKKLQFSRGGGPGTSRTSPRLCGLYTYKKGLCVVFLLLFLHPIWVGIKETGVVGGKGEKWGMGKVEGRKIKRSGGELGMGKREMDKSSFIFPKGFFGAEGGERLAGRRILEVWKITLECFFFVIIIIRKWGFFWLFFWLGYICAPVVFLCRCRGF